MATGKKLPSGSWRVQVYSHTEEIPQPDGTTKKKRVYKSFTSDIPGPKGKRDVERQAADWAAKKEEVLKVKNITLGTAIDKYIESKDAVLSVTTISDYKKKRKNSFKFLMDVPIRDITTEMLQEAVNQEAKRKSQKKPSETISAKTVKNEYGLITATLNTYRKDLNCSVTLPKYHRQIKELNTPDAIFSIFEGTDIELPVLLAMWLSFSMSEIRGLTKSKSISGDYITIHEVLVSADNKDVIKSTGKVQTRLRRHKMPPYIKSLIDKVPGDIIAPMTYNKIHHKFDKLIEQSGIPHMTFHDLRHINASVMAMLNIPEKYAQERGGWKTPHVMKNVYTHTFSKERKEVDNKIDRYFENMMQHDVQHENKKLQ
ncbi:tyrosine-type recombinase/integrase [Blautia hansenii]|uniref:tyrosine-type recombinase/integrase n=1 Tax=Blautia hansenii TaxID=1322 RepID=UPI00398420E5